MESQIKKMYRKNYFLNEKKKLNFFKCSFNFFFLAFHHSHFSDFCCGLSHAGPMANVIVHY